MTPRSPTHYLARVAIKFTRQVRFWVAMSLLWPCGACAFDGDVNSDATLDVSDVQCLVLAILDLSPDGTSSLPCLEDLSAADMNGDSVLNIVDLQLLVRAILGPHPFPEDPGPPPPVPPLVVELDEGTNMSAAISPNGESIAFTLQGTLWTIPVEGGAATAITDAMGDSHIPTWSPDSQWIAFQSFRSGSYHIWKIRADGTGLEQLTHGVHDDREPHWAPSGTHLAFSSDRSGSYDIWTITLATGALERRTSTVDDASWPCYSPNGEQIAILSEEKGLYLLKEDQEEPEFIFAGSDISAPSWTPDGEALIFPRVGSATTKQQKFDLQSGSAQYLSTHDIDIFPFRATWLNGDLIYTADGGIKRRALDQSQPTSIPFSAEVKLWRAPYEKRAYPFNNTEPRPALGIRAPVLSPDGEAVVFSALGDIWLKPVDAPAQQLTNDHFVDLDPSWSPNGEQVVFTSDRSGDMELWVLNVGDGLKHQLTDSGKDLVYPAWSPDGASIACFEVGRKNLWSNATLKLVTVSSGNLSTAHSGLFVPSRPSWSPDSRYLALATLKRASSRYREGVSEIRIIDVQTSQKSTFSPSENISLGPRGASGPAWSPDGSSIAYVQGGTLWSQEVTASGSPVGTPAPITQGPGAFPTWSQDLRLLYLKHGQLKLLEPQSGAHSAVDPGLNWVPEVHTGHYYIHAGRMWDGLENEYLENMDIVVEGQRIVAIEAHQERDIPKVDASQSTVIPGLFDMHVHQHGVVGERLGRSWLGHGITSVREVGSDAYDALERKEAWASGARPGPRLFFTGNMIDGTRIYYGLANSVTTPEHRAWEMAKTEALGFDLVKTYVRLPDADLKQLTEQAHELGIPITSHELYPAVAYGVDGVEHLGATSRRGFSLKQSALRIAYNDTLKLLAESGMYMTPTLGVSGGAVMHISLEPEVLTTEAYLKLVPEKHRQNFEDAYFRSTVSNTRRLMVERQQLFIRQLLDAGGKITGGTDVPFLPFGWSLHIELQLYVDGGLTPFEALRSVTSWAAESTGVGDDLGSLVPGKLADMVIVQGDPLTSIRDAWQVESVIKGGKLYTIDELLNP